MDGYVVRIYRREPSTSAVDGQVALIGVVESPLDQQRRAFHDSSELWSILVDMTHRTAEAHEQ